MFTKKYILSLPCLAGLFFITVCLGSEGFAPRLATAGTSPQTGAVTDTAGANQLQSGSVLERFRTFSGQRTPLALSELFKSPVSSSYSQKPEIALSNGATIVSIKTVLPAQDGSVPNFALIGARMLSCSQNKQGEWVIEALPEIEVARAELVVSSGTAILEFPLVVAPPLPSDTDLSEQGFIRFLAGKDRTALPQQDLNGDGRIDYQDDYIYTANYLVRKSSPPGAPDSGKQSPVIQDAGITKGVDKRQEPVKEAVQAPQPSPQSAPPQNPNPHSLSNRNERARQMKQLLNQ